ncbi:MAG: isochorismate synthase [Eggerthellaceae bacterium]|nr:isochorismate synthase [Eggerthellaceae bacterium]
MTKIFSFTQAVQTDIVDAFCVLQKGFTDQFVYYDKNPDPAQKTRYMGLGRCIALHSLHEVESVLQGEAPIEPILFSFQRFDAENPKAPNKLFEAYPNLKLLLPELVLIENEQGAFLQVNSLGPVYPGRVERFSRQVAQAPERRRTSIAYELDADSAADWDTMVAAGLAAIEANRVEKVVLSRRLRLRAQQPFSSKDLLVNLIDGSARGTVLLYRYGDVFFCGCTPELLIRKRGQEVESMCLAGTTGVGKSPEECELLAQALLHDEKNLREHAFVVDFIREVFRRNCHGVEIAQQPEIMTLQHVQHLYTPARAKVMEGLGLDDLLKQLHPTPALSGTPVGEALMLIRQIEGYNRGFFGGTCGYVNAAGDGEFSVGLRTGVFDGEIGWVYAGCGIVSQSNPAAEYRETDLKLKTILSAFSEE